MTEVGSILSTVGLHGLGQTHQASGTVVPSLPLDRLQRTSTLIAAPAKRIVDTYFVAYAARRSLTQGLHPVTSRHWASSNPHSPTAVAAI